MRYARFRSGQHPSNSADIRFYADGATIRVQRWVAKWPSLLSGELPPDVSVADIKSDNENLTSLLRRARPEPRRSPPINGDEQRCIFRSQLEYLQSLPYFGIFSS
jgi:hypothetical protein